jgi:hypothetical protein
MQLQVLSADGHEHAATMMNVLADQVTFTAQQSLHVLRLHLYFSMVLQHHNVTQLALFEDRAHDDLQMRCEKIVLCKTAADAQQAIHAANVLAVYCPDGSKRYKKRSTLVSIYKHL